MKQVIRVYDNWIDASNWSGIELDFDEETQEAVLSSVRAIRSWVGFIPSDEKVAWMIKQMGEGAALVCSMHREDGSKI